MRGIIEDPKLDGRNDSAAKVKQHVNQTGDYKGRTCMFHFFGKCFKTRYVTSTLQSYLPGLESASTLVFGSFCCKPKNTV